MARFCSINPSQEDAYSRSLRILATTYAEMDKNPAAAEAARLFLESMTGDPNPDTVADRLKAMGFQDDVAEASAQLLMESAGTTYLPDVADLMVANLLDTNETSRTADPEMAEGIKERLTSSTLSNDEFKMANPTQKGKHWDAIINSVGDGDSLEYLDLMARKYPWTYMPNNKVDKLREAVIKTHGGPAKTAEAVTKYYKRHKTLPYLLHHMLSRGASASERTAGEPGAVSQLWDEIALADGGKVLDAVMKEADAYATNATVINASERVDPVEKPDAFTVLTRNMTAIRKFLTAFGDKYINSPVYVLSRIGEAPDMESFSYESSQSAFATLSDSILAADNQLVAWHKELEPTLRLLSSNPDADAIIFQFLDGKIDLGIVPQPLQGTATQLRDFLGTLVEQQHTAAIRAHTERASSYRATIEMIRETMPNGADRKKLLGTMNAKLADIEDSLLILEEGPSRRGNYITWLHRAHLPQIRSSKGEWIGNPNVRQKFLEGRYGTEHDRLQSTAGSLAAYLPYAARKIHIEKALFAVETDLNIAKRQDPAANMLRMLIEMIAQPGNSPSLKTIEDIGNYVDQLDGNPESADLLVNMLKTLTSRVYPGFIDAVETPVVNLTQMTNSAALMSGKLGNSGRGIFRSIAEANVRVTDGFTWAAYRGYKKLWSKLTGGTEADAAELAAGVLAHNQSMYAFDLISELNEEYGKTNPNVVKRMSDALDWVALAGQRSTEYLNRMGTFRAFKKFAMSEGHTEEEAIRMGAVAAGVTQFRTDVLGSHPRMQGPLPGALFPLVKFGWRQFEFVRRQMYQPIAEANGGGPGGFFLSMIKAWQPKQWEDPLFRQGAIASATWLVNTNVAAVAVGAFLSFGAQGADDDEASYMEDPIRAAMQDWQRGIMYTTMGAIPSAIVGPLMGGVYETVGAIVGRPGAKQKAINTFRRLIPTQRRWITQPRNIPGLLDNESIGGQFMDVAGAALNTLAPTASAPVRSPETQASEGTIGVPTTNQVNRNIDAARNKDRR